MQMKIEDLGHEIDKDGESRCSQNQCSFEVFTTEQRA